MSIELETTVGGAVQVSPEILQSFKAGFRGPVLAPDAPEYDEQRKVWNAMIDRRPGLIARCTGTADVVAAVRFARKHQFLLSVRGGGHNIAGMAVCDGGMMIDLSSDARRLRRPEGAHRARAGRLHPRRRRPRDATARPGRGAGLRLGHRHRRPHRGRRLRLPDAPLRLDLRQRRLDGSSHREGRRGARRSRRERRALLGPARRRRQLRHRHVVRVPAVPRRPRDPRRRDRLARRRCG